MHRWDYYRMSKVKPEMVRRYSIRQAVEAAEFLRHTGPWQEPLEPTCDDSWPADMLLPNDWKWRA